MNSLETWIAATFPTYRHEGIAHLAVMPVPMVPTHQRDRNGCPMYRPSGQAPFDVYGQMCGSGLFVGAELKQTEAFENRIRIVGPAQKGSGLQFHQLQALYDTATNGGIARLVWRNAGEIGVYGPTSITAAYKGYLDALEGKGKAGAKSIPWDEAIVLREPVRLLNGGMGWDWLLHREAMEGV